jgi:2-polyprenyl-6-methoxyphenol hydroxylase-like FAD-dependent oxidoreductase
MEPISIVGGGIAGLALAASLDPGRFEVAVYEKRPELPTVGTALGMWPNAQRALARVGVLEEARAVSPVIGSGSVRNAAGESWVTVDGGGMFGISRIDLLRLLDAAVPGTVRRVTRHVQALPADGGLLVGADGVHSLVRREAWGARNAARLTPYLALRGTLPSRVSPDAVGEYWGRGGPVRYGRLVQRYVLVRQLPVRTRPLWNRCSGSPGAGPEALRRARASHPSSAGGRYARKLPRAADLDSSPARFVRSRQGGPGRRCRTRHDAHPRTRRLRVVGGRGDTR